MITFAERLKEGLELRNKTRAQLAKETGISEGALSNYYHGKYEPNATNIYLIAKALNVSEAWLLGFEIVVDMTEEKLLFINEQLSEDGKDKLLQYARFLLQEESKNEER